MWLRSEWDKVPPPRPQDRWLVDAADLTDQGQNAARAELLNRDRSKILAALPAEIGPVWVEVEEADLYIVPSFDCYLDTGRTFRLVDTNGNLAHGRGFLSSQGRQPIDHLAKVEGIDPNLADYSSLTTDDVLIAADKVGPFTIIDGTHRAAALYRRQLSEPNMPWRGILVADPAIRQCLWHIESPDAAANIQLCQQAAAQRLLWLQNGLGGDNLPGVPFMHPQPGSFGLLLARRQRRIPSSRLTHGREARVRPAAAASAPGPNSRGDRA